MNKGFKCCAGFRVGIVLAVGATAYAQIDPEARELLHLGVNQSLHDDGPAALYAFYYWNMPDVPTTNQTLRLVVAPTCLDSELGFKNLLGDNTDLALGLFGGGFAYSDTSKNQRWKAELVSAYGFDAIRSNGRGGYNVGMMFQYNFGKTKFASDQAIEELRNVRVPGP